MKGCQTLAYKIVEKSTEKRKEMERFEEETLMAELEEKRYDV